MSDTNIDYDKTNKYLPESLRAFVGATNRVSRMDFRAYTPMFRGVEQLAVFNNVTAAEFASGFTNLNYKYLRSGVAPELEKIVVSKTIGRVYYQTDIDEATLNEKFDKDYCSDCLYKAFDEAAMTGRSAIAMYQERENAEVNLISYNLFRHKLRFDKRKNVIEAFLYISNFKGNEVGFDYFVCEHRFLKQGKDQAGNRIDIPYQEFLVYGSEYKTESKKDRIINVLEGNAIPNKITEAFSDITFNRPQKLLFNGIGVFDIKYTLTNQKFIDSDIPEAMFVNAVDNALTIDTSITGKEVEKEIGRGQILIPEFGRGGDIGYQAQGMVGMNVLRTFGTTYKNPIIMPYPTRSMEDSKPTNVQFDIRSEQWNLQIDADTARLCECVGVGIIDYCPRLLGGNQRTDDEINAMTDITANTVQNFRNINTKKVNDLLEAIVEAVGLEKPVAIRWSMAAILNPTKNTDLVIKQLQAGLISRKRAIQAINPDLTPQEVEQLTKEVLDEAQELDVANSFSNF